MFTYTTNPHILSLSLARSLALAPSHLVSITYVYLYAIYIYIYTIQPCIPPSKTHTYIQINDLSLYCYREILNVIYKDNVPTSFLLLLLLHFISSFFLFLLLLLLPIRYDTIWMDGLVRCVREG